MKELSVNQLVIEVGRKCNLRCEHCLRGEPEDTTIDVAMVKKFLKEFTYISVITFSGGEPTINKDELLECIMYCKARNKKVTIISNGTLIDDELLVKKYVETMIRRTFGTENAMKLGKPMRSA